MGDKAAKLNSDVAEREAAARGGLFDSDDPTRTQHKYALRAALWHDGFMTPGKHLYAYVREGDEWWRVQGSAERTSFAEMQADTTGQFTDGGPYLLIYSRTGPRPPMPEGEVPEGAAQREDAGGVMDVDGDEAVGLPALVPTVSPTAMPTLPPAPTPAPASVTAAPTAAPAPAVPVATSPAPPPARALPLSPKRAVRGPRPISHKSHSGSMSGSMSSMSSNDGDWDRRAAASPSTANWTETLETVTASPVDGPADVFAALLAPKKQDKGKDGDGDQIM
jgi:hypothetical protein